jgi:hypothetical protein
MPFAKTINNQQSTLNLGLADLRRQGEQEGQGRHADTVDERQAEGSAEVQGISANAPTRAW